MDLNAVMLARLGDRVVVAPDIYARLRGMGYEDIRNAVEVVERPGQHVDIRAWIIAAFLSWATSPDPRSCMPIQESGFVEPGTWIMFQCGRMIAMGRLAAEREA